MNGSFVDLEILSYSHSIINTSDISSTGNKEDVVLEPWKNAERVCIFRPGGVADDHFYFYIGVLEDSKIHIPFSDFEAELLIVLNIAPSQLCPNGWGFIKAFGVVCEYI